ncbi:PREDICTED: defensin-like protein 8 [Camelina sativa]|uniref:Defensin-like protein 8 n=1 Tax=Camelina sativa TaxID=90675 RepID=A0ABM1RLQ6_CAMSA|nr:PREDICTED: defensin-like protein 8 [Camelina sativa]XP_019099945.1 PREDICTED: defensin-like protein 8 [Camelina sativa]XP_019099947.1 PREDICTED: defensin-like protein 8 [Camelina sativa]
MKLSNRVLSALLLISFILIAATTEMGLADKICKTRSDRFSGVCFSSNNCAIICQLFEQFEGGQCEFEGAFRRCLCTKAC